jgi:glutamate/tyrosine decarboxylase-like PLP-dependent enzyme
LYTSPTFAGSRSGALVAVSWAAMLSMGEQGYMTAAKKILENTVWMRDAIAGIPGLHLLGNSLFVVAFAADGFNIYNVMDFMSARKWNLNPLQKPAGVHLSVTLRHTQPGVRERFIADLSEAVAHVKANPAETGSSAPLYGTASTLPLRGVVGDMLKRYIDLLYRV